MNQIDDTTIQLIVDGEIDKRDRERLLSRLDSDDPTWKQIVCAFLANQELDRTISKLVDDQLSDSTVDSVQTGNSDRQTRQYAGGDGKNVNAFGPKISANGKHRGSATITKWSEQKKAKRQWSKRMIAICAAIMLCAVSLGIGRAWFSETVIVERTVPQSASDRQELTISEALSRCVTPVPDNFHRDMIAAGYLIDERQRITSVRLPTGEKMDIPIREIKIHELGMSAYQ